MGGSKKRSRQDIEPAAPPANILREVAPRIIAKQAQDIEPAAPPPAKILREVAPRRIAPVNLLWRGLALELATGDALELAKGVVWSGLRLGVERG